MLKQDNIFVLENGRSVKFWEDPRCGEVTLSSCELFPSLYALVGTEGAMVADV